LNYNFFDFFTNRWLLEGSSLVTLQMQSKVIAAAETAIAVAAFERLGSSVFPVVSR